ncbi:MAG: thiosulfate oxidation carrier protein SoxY [Burkholderiaceae bacterium]|nr:thiosulfate oxidation carrier protein SoxY [Sulfuritalea sp.]MCF8174928.1 thiosulfate oxidation carrier protein SoxY [Burkholderiaceae bacterium]MCF8183575.1 thiosulfate oxidation carrier protein SoxY [Polynucleobacter sp.]
MNVTRRTVLRGAGSLGALSALIAAGVLKPTAAFAAEWNKAAFEAQDTTGVLKGLGAGTPGEHKGLILKVPDIAENGAVVPVDVVSTIPNTVSIAILVEKNPLPLSAHFDFANGALPEAAVRLKLGQTSLVKAVVKADGKFYIAQKEVKVTVGGCGG